MLTLHHPDPHTVTLDMELAAEGAELARQIVAAAAPEQVSLLISNRGPGWWVWMVIFRDGRELSGMSNTFRVAMAAALATVEARS